MKVDQLIELLKLKPKDNGEKYRKAKIEHLNKFFSKGVEQAIFEFNVDDQAKCNAFFEEVANRIKEKETS